MRLTETAREFRRRRGVELMDEGVRQVLITRVLGVSRASLHRWRKRACSEGGLIFRSPSGSRRKLTDEQLGELRELLLKGATAHGWVNDLWTGKRVVAIIQRHFGKKYSLSQVYTVLKDYLGWTPQRPIRQLVGRDDAKIRKWLTESYPAILERARTRGAYLVFVDESGFMLAPVLRRTFSPRGHRPVIKSAEPHERISVIGAITVSPERKHFGFHFYLLNDNANFHGDSVVPFIDVVRRTIRGPITLLWDGIRIHSAKPMAAYLATHKTIVVEPFPPCAPELNPVDRVWGYVKYDRLPNFTPPNLTELRGGITAEFSRLQKRPQLVESLFRRTGLILDPRRALDNPTGTPTKTKCHPTTERKRT